MRIKQIQGKLFKIGLKFMLNRQPCLMALIDITDHNLYKNQISACRIYKYVVSPLQCMP